MARENYFTLLRIKSDAKDKDIQEALTRFENETKTAQGLKSMSDDEIKARQALLAEMKSWSTNKDAVKTERDEFIKIQSDAVRSYFCLLPNNYEAYKREVNSWCEKYGLERKIIEKLMGEDPNHQIKQIEGKPLPPNFIIAQFGDYAKAITAVNESPTLNKLWPWSKDVTDLYSYLAGLLGKSVSEVRSMDTAEIATFISKYSADTINKAGGSSGQTSAPVRTIFGQLQIVFDPSKPEKRTQYDNTLKYESLRPIFDSISKAGAMRKDDKFVENMLVKIREKFNDYELALTIYNVEAKLAKTDPYEPPKVIISMVCGNCGSTQDFKTRNEALSGKCAMCGTSYYMQCPSCNKMIPSNSRVCPECGLNLGEMKKAPEYFAKAKAALLRSDYDEANAFIQQAEFADPKRMELKKCPDFDQVKAKIAAQYEQFKKYLTTLNNLILAKKFVHAKEECERVKMQNPQINIANQLKQINEALDKAKAMMHSITDNSENSVSKCYEILDIVSDYLPAAEFIKKVPLQPVSGFVASPLSGEKFGCGITWQPSKHVRVSYFLVKNDAHEPKNYTDGTLILKESTDVSYQDYDVVSGKKYYYAVFVMREGIFSMGATAAFAAYTDVTNLEATVQGIKCSINFKLPVNSIGARVIRKENAIPTGPNDPGAQIVGNDVRGAIDDTSLQVDHQYGYLVQACYLENNVKVYTKGVGKVVKIERDPTPLSNVVISKESGLITVSYTPQDATSPNAVRVYSINPKQVEGKLNKMMSIEEANVYLTGQTLVASGRARDGKFSFSLTGNFAYDVIVVSCTDSKAIFTTLGKISSLENVVVDVAKSEIKVGSTAYVRLKNLPMNIYGIYYMILEPDHPKNEITPQDRSSSQASFMSAIDYRKEGLIPVVNKNVAAGKFKILVASQYLLNGKYVVSETSTYIISKSEAVELNYKLIWKKRGLFKKGYDCSLVIETQAESIPHLVMMAKDQGSPISISDVNAYKIFELDSSTPKVTTQNGRNKVHTYVVPSDQLFAGMNIRLFPATGGTSKLIASDYDTLKVPK